MVKSKKRIIIIDDDHVMARVLQLSLKLKGFETSCYYSADEALAAIDESPRVDLFILDYHLDDVTKDGFTLCKLIKRKFNKPIIMLTRESSTDAKVACLYAGADQYVLKPYVLEELLAVIHVSLGHYKSDEQETNHFTETSFGNLTIDTKHRSVRNGDKRIKLTDRELQLIETLADQTNRYIPRDEIYIRIFGSQMPPLNRAVDILVGRLRKKIAEIDSDVVIQSSRNKGYGIFSLSGSDDGAIPS